MRNHLHKALLGAVVLGLLVVAVGCAALGIEGIEGVGANHVKADRSFDLTLRLLDLDGWVAAGAPFGERSLLDLAEREAVQANIDAWRLHVAQAEARVAMPGAGQ